MADEATFENRNPVAEAKFREWNLTFTLNPEFKTADIRIAEWAQVREGPHRAPKAASTEYAEQMRGGVQFPPLVLMAPDVLLDGNTRLRAAEMNRRKVFPCYIVNTGTVEMAKALGAALNQMNGVRLTDDEACAMAATMLDRGFSDAAVSKETGKKAPWIRSWRKEHDAKAHASRLGLDKELDRLNKTSRYALADVKHDLPFSECLQLASDVKLPVKDLKALVEKMAAAPSDEAQVAMVQALRAEVQPAGPPPHVPNINPFPKQANMQIHALLKHEAEPHLLVDLAKRDDEVEKWERLAKLTSAVLDVLGPRSGE